MDHTIKQAAKKNRLDFLAIGPESIKKAPTFSYPTPMPKRSAGVLLFRRTGPEVEVLLAHPGGPFWKNKDVGAWSIPKGEYTDDEDPLTAARRELQEETGLVASGEFLPLGEIRQRGGKVVIAWALEGDLDATSIHSNTFSMPWPPGSGKLQ